MAKLENSFTLLTDLDGEHGGATSSIKNPPPQAAEKRVRSTKTKTAPPRPPSGGKKTARGIQEQKQVQDKGKREESKVIEKKSKSIGGKFWPILQN